MEPQKEFFEVLEQSFATQKKSWFLFFFLSFLFLFLSFLSFSFSPKNTQAYFLSVGEGDSELLFIGDVKILIDGGPQNGRVTEALGKILPFWDKRIDLVILTHPDLDHVGGLPKVFEQFQVGGFLSIGATSTNEAFQTLSQTLSILHTKTIPFFAGDTIAIGEAKIRALSPQRTATCSETNECALVLLFSSHGKKILYTADITSAQEKELLPLLPPIDVLKVAHHGSRFSTSESFLLKTAPQVAIIEVGKNSFGHPAPEIMMRFEKFHIPVFRTDQNGTIGVRFSSKTLTVFSLE